ncbi:MAG: hypothetical protein IKD79_02960 [Oscillospiraceae bacterium]|nr:hypothetical protein [Oscillospiraceae bacterium]
MFFSLEGSDPRFPFLKRRLEADGHCVVPNGGHVIAPPRERRGIPYYDDPVYTLRNAALTAEAAAELLMRSADRPVAGMRVLVAGRGRVGSLLADTLAALGARVTVAARRPDARAAAEIRGHQSVDINQIPDHFEAVLNTVPAPVLSGDYGGALCIDLAGAPGGWADDTPVLKAPGLPGRYAPKAAADILAEAVYRVMEVDIK